MEICYAYFMLGSEFKKRRDGLGLTQEQIAEELGVQPNAIWRWETGKVPISKTIELALQTIERKYIDDPILFSKLEETDDSDETIKGIKIE